jgi:hypothetical protein
MKFNSFALVFLLTGIFATNLQINQKLAFPAANQSKSWEFSQNYQNVIEARKADPKKNLLEYFFAF